MATCQVISAPGACRPVHPAGETSLGQLPNRALLVQAEPARGQPATCGLRQQVQADASDLGARGHPGTLVGEAREIFDVFSELGEKLIASRLQRLVLEGFGRFRNVRSAA